MKIPEKSWDEADVFLRGLGYAGDILSKAGFRSDAGHFMEILLAKNEELNLTGAKDLETAFWKHLGDSRSILIFPDLGITADWGCGGGFPGIPLALARKHSSDNTPVFFVDSIAKKVRAVEGFCAELGLANTKGYVGRGEDLIRSGALSLVNTAVMRAVAPAGRAWKWVTPSIPSWLFFLGPRQREEWHRELSKLSNKKIVVSDQREFSLPHDLGQRCFLRLSKSSTWN